MKIILTGATGFIGGAVLKRAIADPNITSIITLSRRNLENEHRKVQNIIQRDFLEYDRPLLDQLAGAEACIWCQGQSTGDRKVQVDYPMAAVKAFSEALVPQMDPGKRFRFIYLSGALSEKDPNKSLWFLGELRRLRGECELGMVYFEEQNQPKWQSIVARPGWVTAPNSWQATVAPAFTSIGLKTLAAAMVDVAVHSSEVQMLENADLKTHGSALLARS